MNIISRKRKEVWDQNGYDFYFLDFYFGIKILEPQNKEDIFIKVLIKRSYHDEAIFQSYIDYRNAIKQLKLNYYLGFK